MGIANTKKLIAAQVVDLPLAKRLKAAGYPQTGIYVWFNFNNGADPATDLDENFELKEAYDGILTSDYIAPTPAELAEKFAITPGEKMTIKVYWGVYSVSFGEEGETAPTLAEALGELWIKVKGAKNGG